MKKFSLLLVMLVIGFTSAYSQILKPVKWEFGSKKINDKEAVVFMKAKIDKGWHIYSLNVEDGGPIKTSFAFAPSKDYSLVGKPSEPKPKTKWEEVFGMDVAYHNVEVVFQQRVKLNKGQATIKGTVEFMVCNAEQCLPPDEIPFTVTIK
jgi:DsbC/DsbD-like thiol-disulfide interchange protein